MVRVRVRVCVWGTLNLCGRVRVWVLRAGSVGTRGPGAVGWGCGGVGDLCAKPGAV